MNEYQIDNCVVLFLASEMQKNAVLRALECLEENPCILAAVFEGKCAAESFRSSVGANLLFDVQHPFQLDEQINLSDLLDLLSDQVKIVLANK